MAVVGNDNIDVGNERLTRKPGEPAVEIPADGSSRPPIDRQSLLDRQSLPKAERPRISGAMAQQCADMGRDNHSAPQKFVRLVGCRDPKARPEQR
jgi:hypothetical protein